MERAQIATDRQATTDRCLLPLKWRNGRVFAQKRKWRALGESALLDWNDDRLAFLRNKEIDSPRPLCCARVPDQVNSLVRIGAERPFAYAGKSYSFTHERQPDVPMS